jgi:uncharacterized protein with von Willebrand factor type A (vWA) domain
VTTYPFASLPENLAAFCGVLRRHYQFRIGPRELTDAARGLAVTDLASERAVRDALRTVLSKSHDDVVRFDGAFDRFFRGDHRMQRANRRHGSAGSADVPRAANDGPPEAVRPPGAQREIAAAGPGRGVVAGLEDGRDQASATLLRASYSPLDAEGAALVLEPPTRPWLEAAAALVRRVQTAVSRRWRPAPRGPRFDFRRTLRTSLRTAGEPAVPRWRAHPRRHARFVVFIDGSRSMGSSAAPVLRLATALSAVHPSTETFAFSTELRRVTPHVRRAAAGHVVPVDLRQAWGGGTAIGRCLQEFLHRFGERLLRHGAVFVIASDGLDLGDADALRQSMQRLARRAAAVIWINPLLDTPGYEPTAIGMSVARPHVSLLTSVADPDGLRALARRVRIR